MILENLLCPLGSEEALRCSKILITAITEFVKNYEQNEQNKIAFAIVYYLSGDAMRSNQPNFVTDLLKSKGNALAVNVFLNYDWQIRRYVALSLASAIIVNGKAPYTISEINQCLSDLK